MFYFIVLLSSAPLFEALVEGRLKGFLYLSYYVFITIALVSYKGCQHLNKAKMIETFHEYNEKNKAFPLHDQIKEASGKL